MDRRVTMFLIPLVALAILGSAVSMWYDVLKVREIIKTGSVDVKFTNKPWATEEMEFNKSWVANCSAVLAEVEEEDPDDNDLDLVITIDNAYPCYTCKVNGVDVKNVGTIPVKLDVKVKINGIKCEIVYNETKVRWEYVCDYDNDAKPEITVYGSITSLTKPKPVQLPPEDEKAFSVDIHVEQDAEEGKTYVIQILIKAIQWNEYS